jgi:hypothetical protein
LLLWLSRGGKWIGGRKKERKKEVTLGRRSSALQAKNKLQRQAGGHCDCLSFFLESCLPLHATP